MISTNPWHHTDPVYPINSSVNRHLPGMLTTIAIDSGLLQTFSTGTPWNTRILSHINDKHTNTAKEFTGDFVNLQEEKNYRRFPGMLDTLKCSVCQRSALCGCWLVSQCISSSKYISHCLPFTRLISDTFTPFLPKNFFILSSATSWGNPRTNSSVAAHRFTTRITYSGQH